MTIHNPINEFPPVLTQPSRRLCFFLAHKNYSSTVLYTSAKINWLTLDLFSHKSAYIYKTLCMKPLTRCDVCAQKQNFLKPIKTQQQQVQKVKFYCNSCYIPQVSLLLMLLHCNKYLFIVNKQCMPLLFFLVFFFFFFIATVIYIVWPSVETNFRDEISAISSLF